TAYEMDLAWWCLDDSTEKEEDVDKVENKVSCKDPKSDANCETSLLEWFWDNADCNDFVKEVENTKERAVKASDEKESSENKKKEDVSGLYSIGHCGNEKKEIKSGVNNDDVLDGDYTMTYDVMNVYFSNDGNRVCEINEKCCSIPEDAEKIDETIVEMDN
ncbi:2004_t:CDS:1, partial [Racocetra fulgida]